MKKSDEIMMTNYYCGQLKKFIFTMLQAKYHFHSWYLTPINFKPYAVHTVKLVNRLIARENISSVVEIGCGIGEIINNVDAPVKYGYDIDENIIKAAEVVSRNNVIFRQGQFGSIKLKNIDILLTVNVLHSIAPEIVREQYLHLMKTGGLRFIVADEVKSNNYQYNHDFGTLLADEFKVIKRYRNFQVTNGTRELVVLERISGKGWT